MKLCSRFGKFERSPQKSTCKCSRGLGIPHLIVCTILRKHIKRKPNQLQQLQVGTELNNQLPEILIGRASPNDNVLLKSPPRSPGITPCDLYHGDTSKINFQQPYYLF